MRRWQLILLAGGIGMILIYEFVAIGLSWLTITQLIQRGGVLVAFFFGFLNGILVDHFFITGRKKLDKQEHTP